MKKIFTITFIILLTGGIFLSGNTTKKNTSYLSPESAFKEDSKHHASIRTMTRYEMGFHILIRPQKQVHTSQYSTFTTDTVSTGGGANCTVLLFLNKTKNNWSIWHYPLLIAKNNLESYMVGEADDPSFLYSLPIALTAIYTDMERDDECVLYIFGGGSNTKAEQQSLNNEIATFFTKAGITEIYDMTPHRQHGQGPILDQLIISKGKNFDASNTEPIIIKYFYGDEVFDVESESLKVAPRLIGGKKLLLSVIDTSKLAATAA